MFHWTEPVSAVNFWPAVVNSILRSSALTWQGVPLRRRIELRAHWPNFVTPQPSQAPGGCVCSQVQLILVTGTPGTCTGCTGIFPSCSTSERGKRELWWLTPSDLESGSWLLIRNEIVSAMQSSHNWGEIQVLSKRFSIQQLWSRHHVHSTFYLDFHLQWESPWNIPTWCLVYWGISDFPLWICAQQSRGKVH